LIFLILTTETRSTQSTIHIKFIGTKTYYGRHNKGYDLILNAIIGDSPTYAVFETTSGYFFEIKLSRNHIDPVDSVNIKEHLFRLNEITEVPSILIESKLLFSKEFKLSAIKIPCLNKKIILN